MTTLRIRLLTAVAVVGALLAVTVPAGAQGVKVGAALSLTGDAAVYGTSSKRGIELAVQELAKGSGPRLDVSFVDDKSTSAGAAAAFGVFFRDGVIAIMGPSLSSVALDVDPFAQGARVPVLGISNSEPGITEIGTFVFRPALTDQYVIPRVVKTVATSKLQPKTAVVVQGSDAYAQASGPMLTAAVTAAGMTLSKAVSVPTGTTDYAPIAADIKATDPDIVLISALAPEGVPLLKAIRAAGYKKRIIGSDAFNAQSVIAEAGPAANGLITGAAWSAATKSTANTAFVKAFKRKFKRTPDAFAATAYAYTYVLAQAARRGGSASQTAMQTQLAAITGGKKASTILGAFRFDANRNGMSPVVVQEVKKGKFGLFAP